MLRFPRFLGAALVCISAILSCSPEKAKEETAPEIKFNIPSGGIVSQTSDGNVLVAFPVAGGSASVSFTSTAEWSTESSAAVPWCTFSPSSGSSGSSKVNISAEKNSSYEGRRTSFTIKSGTIRKTVTVTQEADEAPNENLEVSKDVFSFTSEGGEDTFTITSNVSWAISSTSDWCIVSPKSGKNDGKVTIKVSKQTDMSSRKATVTVKTSSGLYRDIDVLQDGADVFELSPSVVEIPYVSSQFEVKVTATMGYEISSKPDWITEMSKTSDKNTYTHTFKANENTAEEERTGTVVFCNENEVCVPVTVKQGGKTADPVLEVSTTSLSFDAEGGEGSFTVSSNVEWTVSSSQSWCTVTPASGKENGKVTVNVGEHSDTQSRTAKITVKTPSGLTEEITVSQSGVDVFELDPTEVTVPYNGGDFDVKVTSSMGFKLSSTPTWIRHTSTSSDGTVYSFRAEANTSQNERSGSVVFCNDKEVCIPVNVSQAGKPEDPTLSISTNSLTFSSEGGESSVNVTSNDSWTVSSNQSWCTVSPDNGSGNGTIKVKTAEYTQTEKRTATVTVKSSAGLSSVVTVTQSGVDVFSISPSEVTLEAEGGAFSLTVTSSIGFEMSSYPDWVTHVSTSSNGTVFNFRADANDSSEQRTGTISFCNDKEVCIPVTVTQKGLTPSLEVTPMSLYFGENAESLTFNISSNVGWTISSDKTWCKVSSASGSKNAEITLTVEANSDTQSRTANITVKSTEGDITRTVVAYQDGNESLTFDWTKSFHHKSLLMKFTATWCGWCPVMAETARLYQSQYPGTLEVVNLHASGSSLYASDFNTLISTFNSGGSYPHGMVDQRQDLENYSSEYGASLLKKFVDEQEANYPTVSTVGYTSSFSGNTLDINLKMYLKEADSYKVTVIVTESGIIGFQADYTNGNNDSFEHTNVARIAVTDALGEAFTTEKANSIVSRKYSVNIPTSYVKDNLKILVYIQRAYGSQTVIRSGSYSDYYVDNCAVGKAGGKLSPAIGSEGEGGNEDLGNGNPINW